MKVTDAIRGEHAVYYAWLDEFEELVEGDDSPVSIPAFARLFQSALAGHAMLEDELLFGRLEGVEAAEEALEAVRDDHHRLNDGLSELVEMDDGSEARTVARDLIELAREHFGREETSVLPVAERELDDAVLEEAGGEWADRRGVLLGDE